MTTRRIRRNERPGAGGSLRSPRAGLRVLGPSTAEGRLRAATRRRLGRIADEQRGLTLVELLVTIAVMGMVMMATLGLLDSSAKVAPRDAERAVAIGEAQAGLNRMVRELRQAYRVVAWTPSSIEVRVSVGRDDAGTTGPDYENLTVEYSCGAGEGAGCVRREAPAGGALPATGTTVIDRVLNGGDGAATSRAVFDFDQTPDRSGSGLPPSVAPAYVTVRVEVPAAGELGEAGHEHTVVLEDGFYARNVGGAR